MSSTEKLLQATLNRLGARIGQKLIKTAVELAVVAQEAPEKLQKEWELFQDEVIAEADQLENESKEEVSDENINSQDYEIEKPQQKIDQIRAKVADLSSKIEAKN